MKKYILLVLILNFSLLTMAQMTAQQMGEMAFDPSYNSNTTQNSGVFDFIRRYFTPQSYEEIQGEFKNKFKGSKLEKIMNLAGQCSLQLPSGEFVDNSEECVQGRNEAMDLGNKIQRDIELSKQKVKCFEDSVSESNPNGLTPEDCMRMYPLSK